MTESAQLFKGVHDTPVYTDILFKKPLRLWVAISLYAGTALTVGLTILTLDSGHARAILIYGLLLTGAAAGAAALIPRGRPSLRFRITSAWRAVRPVSASSSTDPLLTPPCTVIGNLSFTAHGVYAHYLITGLPYYLQSTKRRIGVADRHQTLAREIPAGSWVFGLSVPQNQRQLLRAMLDGHLDQPRWLESCRQMAPVIAEQTPRSRIYWLALPVDAGRAGHSPVGQVAKLRDWVIGRDKDSDDSVAAYQRLAYDVITALPEEFGPQPVSAEMMDWFWRHNAWRGVFHNPLPRPAGAVELDTTALPVAVFDDGDQHHNGGRSLPLRLTAAGLAGLAAAAAVLVGPLLAAPFAGLATLAILVWAAGIRRIPSWRKTLRVSSPQGVHPDSYQAILPVVDMPKAGIVFPGSEFLQALDDLDTGATFDFAVNLVTLSREMEFVRNDRAKGNIDDQFTQRRDVRNGDAELITTWRQLAEYNRQLEANIDERPLHAAFLIAVGAPDQHTLDYSVKRLREELTASGQIAIRHYRGAQTKLWAAFNPAAPTHKTTVDQFAQPTTTKKWSRFVPFTSSMVGNSTGILLGFNRNNALNSAVLLDLPATARRNRNPCLVCSGALGYGKSYAAKRITRGEIQRGAQAFIVDPGTEWQKALADVDNKAVIDMAGNQFSCDPLRTFPAGVAGGYWLDYMVPMMSLDPRSVGVRRLRTLLHPDARERLGITSTAALMTYISKIQAPSTGPDTRSPQVVQLADDLAPILAALHSWATYDFTQAIFDATLPVPDLDRLDVSIWLTGSLDLPTAEEMNTPHLYERLSDRKRASVAIYGMLVRLARVTFFADSTRFGLIVVEEAAALLNSRAGADDAHLISRRARKHYTGLLIITQDPIRDLALMGDQFITQQLIMPFENEDLARQVAAKVGIRLDDYPDIEEFFLAQPSPDEMRDPTAFNDLDTAAHPNRGARQGYGFFIDEFRRKSPIWVASEPDPALHHAYDTTPGRSA
ncbi:ATP-binding protein [Mycobacterium riyadhense]|uniref:ATP-binding protein n=1 Tax=Mycobacterium riyadhense TaxID=486698 RepID=UPI0019567775|nr:ATP-binding protein [Mycobacterium riyadhense]